MLEKEGCNEMMAFGTAFFWSQFALDGGGGDKLQIPLPANLPVF